MEDQPLEYIKTEFPNAWAKWAAFAMRIPREDFHTWDWFGEFFSQEGITYTGDATLSFKVLEDNINLLA